MSDQYYRQPMEQWSNGTPAQPQNHGFSGFGFSSANYSANGGAHGFSSNFEQNGFASAPAPANNGFAGYTPAPHMNGSNGGTESHAQAGDGEWVDRCNGSDSMEKHLFTAANSGINFDNYENIPVEVSGENTPDPINTFVDAKLHQFIQDNVDKSGYSKPTPVQKYSIPTLMANRDLMSCAQTGSGKTAAFLLPIINHILLNGPEGMMQSQMNANGRRTYFPSVLVLSPTRELAIQIHKEASKFSYRTKIVTAILYGGRENYRDQIMKLRAGCHILIATPGRLIDVIEQEYVGLAGCRYLVLDEADRMLDMGFEPQIRKIVNQGMPPKTQRVTAMFSATFPKEIQVLAQDFLKPNYVFMTVGRVGSTSENIDQQLMFIEEFDKRKALMRILEKEDSTSLVLCFVETKRGANELAYFLQRQNVRAVAIHGDLKQFERERNLEMFRSGTNPVLVATAVAARGLDIPNVRHVVNYDLPGDIDEYVHRIGRTGRCGNTGTATSFFNEKNRAIARDLQSLVQESNQEVPDWLVRFASESRPSGRPMNRRFGGVDTRRANGGAAGGYGGYNGGARGGYQGGMNNAYGGAQNGYGYRSNAYGNNGANGGAYPGPAAYGASFGGNNFYPGAAPGMMPSGGFTRVPSAPSGFGNGFSGGFGAATGGFSGGMPGFATNGAYTPQQNGYAARNPAANGFAGGAPRGFN